MEFKLCEITGLAQAITSLKMSKRNYNADKHFALMEMIHYHTDFTGSLTNADPTDPEVIEIIKELNKVAKYGAGVGGEAWKDDGHDTLLRYIDFAFVTIGLHRAAQDDLDAHAKRFDSRIVRESTRLATFGPGEKSEWYASRIRSVEDMMNTMGYALPTVYTDETGTKWVYSGSGYVREDLIGNKDVMRGNYPECIPSSGLWKINMYDLRHVYMRRNELTSASPELKIGIESLADQIEAAIPGDLGKLIRYDYAYINEVDGKPIYDLVHVMDIKKCYVPRKEDK